MSVCLSVCPSVTRWYSVDTAEDILKSFLTSGSSIIPVYRTKRDGNIPTGIPERYGDVECKGVWKNHDFRPISCFVSKMMQDRAIVTMEANRKPHPSFEWYQFERPWVTSKPDFKITIIFNVKYLKWYKIELYLTWQTDSKGCVVLFTGWLHRCITLMQVWCIGESTGE